MDSVFVNDETPTLLDEHIVMIPDELGVSVDYLLRGTEIKRDMLTSQEIDLITNCR